uniref:Prephenate dehydrogenase n=1 Tax=Echinostoma caproni TaxID=27848 RepID=A0A183A3U8_9TREM
LIENQDSGLQQVGMWKDLVQLLEAKQEVHEANQARQRAGGEYADVT